MAKKKKVEEEYEFVPPPFSEKEFIIKDLSDSKIVIYTTLIGIVVGAIAAAATLYVSAILGLLIIILMVFVLFRLIYRAMRVNFSNFKRSDYVYKGGTYLITALAIWILLLNPPFAVATPPSIRGVPSLSELSSGNHWVNYTLSQSVPPVISPGTVNITARIYYIQDASVFLNLIKNGNTIMGLKMRQTSTYEFSAIFNVTAGSYTFYISARTGSSPVVNSQRYAFTVS